MKIGFNFFYIFIILFYLLYPIQNFSIFINFVKPYYLILLLIIYFYFIFFFKKGYRNYNLNYLFEFYNIYLFFLIFMSFSILWSVQYEDSIYAIIKYFIYFFTGIIFTYLIVQKPNLIIIIAKSIFLSALYIAIFYIFKFFYNGGFSILRGNASMETIAKIASINVGFGGGRNILASWLTFSITFSLPILLYISKNINKIIYLLLSVIIIIPIFLTLSRTSMLALFLFFFVIFIKKEFMFLKKFLNYILLILLFIFLFNIFNLRTFLFERFYLILNTFSGKGTDYGTLGRLELWQYVFKSFIEHPLFGTGIGTLYKGMMEIGGVHNYHNIFLQFLAQMGLIGLSLFLFWTFWLIYISFKNYKYYYHNENDRFISLILLINLFIYYFKALLMFQYFDMEIWTIISMIGGMYVIRKKNRYLYINSSL